MPFKAEKHLQQGQFNQAEVLINQASDKDLQAAQQMQENVNKRLFSAAEAKAKNGELSLTQLNYLKAADYYQQALKLVPSEFAEKQAYYANQAGSALHDAGKYRQAEPLFQRALKIREKVLGAEHPDVASSLNNLALLYKTQGLYEKAEPLFQRSLKIREKVLGAEHPDIAESLNNLAELYKTQGYYEKAEPLYQRALKIMEKSLGKNHPNTKTVQKNYDTLLEKMKK